MSDILPTHANVPATEASAAPRAYAGLPAGISDDRRESPRMPASALPGFTARLLDGPEVEIVNASKSGMLTRSEARLLPGATVGLKFVTRDAVFVLVGKVVRSRLVTLDAGHPVYESAVAFERHFPLLAENPAAALAAAQAAARAHHDEPASPFPREIGRLDGEPTLLTVTAFASGRRTDLLEAFDLAGR